MAWCLRISSSKEGRGKRGKRIKKRRRKGGGTNERKKKKREAILRGAGDDVAVTAAAKAAFFREKEKSRNVRVRKCGAKEGGGEGGEGGWRTRTGKGREEGDKRGRMGRKRERERKGGKREDEEVKIRGMYQESTLKSVGSGLRLRRVRFLEGLSRISSNRILMRPTRRNGTRPWLPPCNPTSRVRTRSRVD